MSNGRAAAAAERSGGADNGSWSCLMTTLLDIKIGFMSANL